MRITTISLVDIAYVGQVSIEKWYCNVPFWWGKYIGTIKIQLHNYPIGLKNVSPPKKLATLHWPYISLSRYTYTYLSAEYLINLHSFQQTTGLLSKGWLESSFSHPSIPIQLRGYYILVMEYIVMGQFYKCILKTFCNIKI